ncbi:MAG: type II toxin-antitoxin system VapC family toxin [Microcoleaceae cyanobacterium]
MYLLDTNICIAILKSDPNAVSRFAQHFQSSCFSCIVVAELYKGVYCSKRIEENLVTLEKFISLLPLVDFDSMAAVEFGKIQGELRRIGKPTGELDAMIASVARSQNFILVTDNLKHFQNIPNLQTENWLIN